MDEQIALIREDEGLPKIVLNTDRAVAMDAEETEETMEVESPWANGKEVEEWKFRRVLVTSFLILFPISMLIPVLPSLLLDILGGDTSGAAYLSGLFGIATMPVSLFIQPVFGALSDRIGRRPMLFVGLLGFAAELSLLAMYRTIYVYAFTRLFAALGALFPSTITACVGDLVVGSGREPEYYGKIGASLGLAFATAPILGGLIVSRWNEETALLISATMSLLNCVFIAMFLPETLARPRSHPVDLKVINFTTLFGRTKLLSALVTIIFFINFTNSWHSLGYLYFHEILGWQSGDLGTFLTILGIVSVLTQGFLTKPVLKALGEMNALKIGFVSNFLYLCILTFARQTWQVYVAAFVDIFAWISMPSLRAIIARQVPPDEQGKLQGSLSAMSTLQDGPSSLLMAAVFGYFSSSARDSFWYMPRVSFAFVLFSSLTAGVLLFRLEKVKQANADGSI